MVSFLRKLFGGAASAPLVNESYLAELGADMHSHLLPGLDDGAETLAQSVALLGAMRDLGYRKLILTPHIMGDFYKNSPATIQPALVQLRAAAVTAGLGDVQLECAAEYYLDEWLGGKLESGEELLSFGGDKRYLLLETSYMNEPFNFHDIIFRLKALGYQPVLAHPERYTYFYGRFSDLQKIHENGVLFQLNLNSLAGYYSTGAQRVAEKLIDARLVDFVGTDAHNLKHTDVLRTKVLATEYLRKVLALPLLNKSLLSG